MNLTEKTPITLDRRIAQIVPEFHLMPIVSEGKHAAVVSLVICQDGSLWLLDALGHWVRLQAIPAETDEPIA